MKSVTRVCFALSVVALASAVTAQAAVTTYNDRNVFNAAVTSQTTLDFEAQNTAPGSFTYYGGTGLSLSGVNFTAPLSGYLYVADVNAVNPSYNWGSGASLLYGSVNENGNLVITLPTNTFSFGLDMMAEADGNADATAGQAFDVDVDGTHYGVTTAQRPTRTFFGLSSDTAISSITLTMNNTLFNFRMLPILDNFSFSSQGGNVPEPGTLGLIGLALAGAALARRRA